MAEVKIVPSKIGWISLLILLGCLIVESQNLTTSLLQPEGVTSWLQPFDRNPMCVQFFIFEKPQLFASIFSSLRHVVR